MFLKKNILIIANIMLFIGCANTTLEPTEDLNLPQETKAYIFDEIKYIISEKLQKTLQKDFLDKYFSVWNDNYIPQKKENIFWGLNTTKGYGESKRKINNTFIDELIKNMDVDKYPSMKKRGIMVKTGNVRLFPTIKPFFSSINGYPFDRWQNSLIFAYTPVRILQLDKTREWYLIESSFVSGWVKSDEVAFISNNDVKLAMNSKAFSVPTSDYISIYDKNKNFLVNARVGMIFERVNANEIITYKKAANGFAVRENTKINGNLFTKFPQRFNQDNITSLIDSLGNENYGWGGMYANRDCSSFIRDIFTNFAIFLPRNSKAQIEHGKDLQYSTYIELPDDNNEKLKIISKYAKPFRTIIWLQGHIMLYIGEVNGMPLVVHDVWGVNTSRGFENLGGITITTLTHGIEKNSSFNDPQTLLDKIKAINILINE